MLMHGRHICDELGTGESADMDVSDPSTAVVASAAAQAAVTKMNAEKDTATGEKPAAAETEKPAAAETEKPVTKVVATGGILLMDREPQNDGTEAAVVVVEEGGWRNVCLAPFLLLSVMIIFGVQTSLTKYLSELGDMECEAPSGGSIKVSSLIQL